MMVYADIGTLRTVVEETFEALGVTDNEAALIEIERLQDVERAANKRAQDERDGEIWDRAASRY